MGTAHRDVAAAGVDVDERTRLAFSALETGAGRWAGLPVPACPGPGAPGLVEAAEVPPDAEEDRQREIAYLRGLLLTATERGGFWRDDEDTEAS